MRARAKDDNAILAVPRDGRAFLVGATGSGKTTLARLLVQDAPYLVVLDPKRRFEMSRPSLVTSHITDLPALGRRQVQTGDAIIYRPTPDELDDEETLDRFFRWIFERQNTTLYIDELANVVSSGLRFPRYLKALYTMGRQLNISVIAATQRPRFVPIFAMSEAERLYKFRLRSPSDNKLLAEYMGPHALQPHSDPHSFYVSVDGEEFPTSEITLKFRGRMKEGGE